jgi:hypothetical protein
MATLGTCAYCANVADATCGTCGATVCPRHKDDDQPSLCTSCAGGGGGLGPVNR